MIKGQFADVNFMLQSRGRRVTAQPHQLSHYWSPKREGAPALRPPLLEYLPFVRWLARISSTAELQIHGNWKVGQDSRLIPWIAPTNQIATLKWLNMAHGERESLNH